MAAVCFAAVALLGFITPVAAQDAGVWMGDRRAAWLKEAAASMPELRRTEHHPVRIVRSVADSTAFQGWRMEPSEPIEALYASSLKQRRKVIVDMGEHMTGYFSLRVNHTGMPADAPIRLRITFAEVPAELNTPFDPYPGGLSRAWLQDETVTVMRLPATVRIERRVACRYVMIEVLAQSSFDFRVEDITLEAVTSASGEAPALAEGTDPMIRRIYDTGLKTLSECMQTVYEDGPKRDQRLWIGDLYLESLANACSFGNHALTRRCLYLLAALADEDGWLHATVYEYPQPEPQYNQHTMDYSLLYGVALLEYLKATGDMTTARELWPVVARQIEIARTYLKDYLYDMQKQPQWWLVFDWKDDLDRHASVQGLMTFAVERGWELAQMVGRERDVRDWPDLVKRMRRASRRAFYDADAGVVVSGLQRQVSYLSQVWMILSGTLTPKEGARAMTAVLSDPTACRPGSPYAYHYVIEALIACGMRDEAREQLLEYWGGMVERGADTFWEVYDPMDDCKSPYGFYPVNSYCHAWSCTPVYFINTYKDIFQR
ncbi:MAG TPA: glycoside hydrolase [Candidatus Alistipes merdipullorum]|nr:glycoside hydrolase [Candidatus Alistipes merdipullorum]